VSTHGNVNLSKLEKNKLKPYKHVMRCISSCCKDKKIKYNKIRKLISKQQGGFLPLLLLPLIGKALLSGAVAAGSGVLVKKVIDG
jgi:hypothetical protein